MVTRTIVLGPEFDHLADDTEETLVGSSYHQDAITTAYQSLQWYRLSRDLPWFVGNQLKLVLPRTNGRPAYSPSPDLLVHTTLGNDFRASLSVAREGPPALIIEVLSPSTGLGTDLDPDGKLGAYATAGVAEYLTFDPTGEIIPDQLRAWRLDSDDRYAPWEPDATWRWQSALGIAFAPQGWRLRVFDEDGTPIPRYDEIALRMQEQLRVQAAQEHILAERERENVALRAELARLRGGESQ